MDPRGAAHAHRQNTGPSRGAPPPPTAPPPTPHTSKHHPPAATHHIRTTAPAGGSCGRLPPAPRHHNQSGTARTTRRTHATPTRPTGTPRPPASTTPTPAPPTTNSATPTPPPPAPPPETRPRTQHAAASTNQSMSMPPPTHATANPPSRGRRKRPHHRTPRATTMTTPPNPHHPPHHTPHHQLPHRPSLTPCTTPQRTAAPPGGRGTGRRAVPPHSGTSTPIRAATLVQAATLGEGVRDFLFDAFLHVARHERPPRATPDGESPPPTGSRIWVPPIDWGRHLVGHPVPERDSTQGRTRYREPNMAHPPPDATPNSTKEWERETWVARMASLSNFRHHVPGGHPHPDEQQPAPSTYMTLMYNLHYTLSTTTYHAPTDHWVVHGTDSLPPRRLHPPHTQPGPRHVRQGEDPDDPHIWGTWEPESLDALLSIRSSYQGLGRAMYCLAKWTQRTWGIPADRWVWVVTLRPQQMEAPPNRGGPTPPRPTTPQLCPYMVAARLMALLWPGPHTPTQNYPHLTEGDMPGIQRCFFETLDYLQQTHPASWSRYGHPPGNPRARTAETTPPRQHQHARITRENARTRPMPEPAPAFSLLTGPSIIRPPPRPGPSRRLPRPLLRLRLHNLHHHDHLIHHHHHHVLIQHSTPQAAEDTSQTGSKPAPTASSPTAAKATPRRSPYPRPSRSPRPPPKAARSQAQAQAQTRRHDGSSGPAPPGCPLRHPAPAVPARRQQRPARRPPTVTDTTAATFMGGARRGRSAARLVPPPPKARTPGPRTAPGSTSSAHAPLPAPDDSPHATHAPLPPPPRSPPNPEAETVRAHPRSTSAYTPTPHAPPRNRTTRNPQARHRRRPPRPHHTHPRTLLRPRPQARPGTVVAALDPHAALGAAEVGPGRALPRGPGPSAPQGVGGNCRLRPAGGWSRRPHGKPCWPMRSTPWESTPATSPRPRTTRTSQAPAGDPPGSTARRHPPVGHHPKPSPARTHPLTHQASAHRHRRHPQHPRSPARHTTRRA